jgi:hypothetical protein
MVVSCDLLCWITTILAGMLVGLKSLVISLDYRSYMSSSVRIWSLRWLFLFLCSYNLDSSVTAGIGARFNIKHVICVFKTKIFFYKISFPTYSYIYIGLSNLNFKPKHASGQFPYAHIRIIRWLISVLTYGFFIYASMPRPRYVCVITLPHYATWCVRLEVAFIYEIAIYVASLLLCNVAPTLR